jgi:predicted dehydrogenase
MAARRSPSSPQPHDDVGRHGAPSPDQTTGATTIGVIGCGDILYRSVLPALHIAGESLRVVGCCDPDGARLRRATDALAQLSPGARGYDHLAQLLAAERLDGVLNLTPAPLHAEVTQVALESGIHVYSEKPLASTPDAAWSLARLADERDVRLQCAPAIMAAPRFRWLKQIVAERRLGKPTLAVGQYANLGPAAIDDYRGNPAVHYGSDVGPLVDQGVYVLHAMTGLLGRARRVQALAAQAIPVRRVRCGHTKAEAVKLECNDHILIHLELEDGILGQVLSSFAVPATRARALEIHLTEGSIGLDDWQDANRSIDVFRDDEHGLAGWVDDLPAGRFAAPTNDLVAVGVLHFIAVLSGRESSLLPAAHACHVLEIIDAVNISIRERSQVAIAPTPEHRQGDARATEAR